MTLRSSRRPGLTLGLALLLASQLAAAAPGQAPDLRDQVAAHHVAYVPEGAGPFPTIIAIPGCSGIAFADGVQEATHPELREDDRLFRRHYLRQAMSLRAAGYAVFLINVHAAEGLLTACRGELSSDVLARYVNAALFWAAEQPAVDPERIHLMGWSMGGRGVVAWLREPRDGVQPLSATAVYPACEGEGPVAAEVPLLMLLGDADDIADPVACDALAAASTAATEVAVRHYPGARHGFDIPDAPARLALSDGFTIGYQEAAAESAWAEILAWLARHDE